jgi:hypothetical protein
LQGLLLLTGALLVPLIQWLDSARPYGRLRART